MLTRKDLKISTEALLELGVSGAGVSFRLGACIGFSRGWSFSAKVDRVEGVGASARYDREASIVPPRPVGGDVGDGMFGGGKMGDVLCPEPLTAARWDEESTARSAALVGSSVCSTRERSWVVWRWVGELFLGMDPSASFLVENWRRRPPVDWLDEGVGAGGDSVDVSKA